MRKTLEQMREESEMESVSYKIRLSAERRKENNEINALRKETQEIARKYPDKIGYPKKIANQIYSYRRNAIHKTRIQLERAEKSLEKELFSLKMIAESYNNVISVPEMDEYIKTLEKSVAMKKELANKLKFLEEFGDDGNPVTNNKHFTIAEQKEYEKYKENPSDYYHSQIWYNEKSDEEIKKEGEQNEN